MSVFFYTKKDTFLHSLDPRVKIAGLLLAFGAAVAAGGIALMLVLLAVLLGLFAAAKSLSSLRKMAALFVLIGIMTFVLWLIFYDGTDLLGSLGPIRIYRDSVHYAAAMSLRFVNMLMAGLLFLSVTSLEDFCDGLILLGVPYRVAFTLSLSFRLVIIFTATGHTIVEAQKVRGNDVEEGGILKRIRAYVPLLVPLILNGIKKAETLTLALESKGFAPDNRIDIRGKYKMSARDAAALGICVVLASTILFLRISGRV